jgi:hypothetical protein
MPGESRTHTPSGDLHTVRRHQVPVHRVGFAPAPWNWTPWEYAGTDGCFHGRWDDPHGTWRSLYTGFSALACYLEVLAPFRADPILLDDLNAIIDEDDDSAHYPTAIAGTLPRSWCQPRLLASGRLTGTFAVPGHPDSLPTLRRRFLTAAKEFDLADLDAAAIRDSRPRTLTQHIAAWIYTLSSGDGVPLAGIEFQSRHGDNLMLWALFERDTASTAPPQITPRCTPHRPSGPRPRRSNAPAPAELVDLSASF